MNAVVRSTMDSQSASSQFGGLAGGAFPPEHSLDLQGRSTTSRYNLYIAAVSCLAQKLSIAMLLIARLAPPYTISQGSITESPTRTLRNAKTLADFTRFNKQVLPYCSWRIVSQLRLCHRVRVANLHTQQPRGNPAIRPRVLLTVNTAYFAQS